MVKKKKKKKKISTRLKRLMKWRMQTERKKRNNFLILAGGQLSKRGAKREPVQSLCKRERKDRRDKSDELNFQEKWNYTHGKRATHNRLWTHGWTRRSFSKRKREINRANRENREETKRKLGARKRTNCRAISTRSFVYEQILPITMLEQFNFLLTNLSIFEHDFEKNLKISRLTNSLAQKWKLDPHSKRGRITRSSPFTITFHLRIILRIRKREGFF